MNKRYALVILFAAAVLFVPGRALLDLPRATPVAAQMYPEEEQDPAPAPEPEEEPTPTPVPSGASAWDDFPDSLDVVIQGATGGFSPKTVAQTVDSVVESSESIQTKIDNITTYSQTYGPLIRTTPKPPQPTLSERFWRWAARQVFFWD